MKPDVRSWDLAETYGKVLDMGGSSIWNLCRILAPMPLGSRHHSSGFVTKTNFIECRNKKLIAEIANSTIDVYTKIHILKPLSLICCTFMPNIDEAKLIGMKMKARTVTM